MNGNPSPPPSRRVRLNVGGRHFETTIATLTGHGKAENFFASLIRHEPPAAGEELFVDRDGDAFGPLLNFLRTGELHVPPGVSEAAVHCEAEYYCIALPQKELPQAQSSPVRFDGLYLSFGAAPRAVDDDGAFERGSIGSAVASGDVRAYLIFYDEGSAMLGRREADGQWSALRCRYSCLAGGLLLVQRETSSDYGSDDGGDGQGHIELSAVVLDAQFIEVITCGRVGRLENPFHFVRSEPPRPGTAFASQARRGPAGGAEGPGGGRVVITFESDESVGVMVTSSMPGWSAASSSKYSAIRNVNFSRTVDFVSLGERGLVEFVQLNALHQPQLIWYRPLLKASHPWR